MWWWIVGYIAVAIIVAGAFSNTDEHGALMGIFWPVTLVAGIVFHVIYGLYSIGEWVGELFR